MTKYSVCGELFNAIKSIYVRSLACVRVKGGESYCFRINSGVRRMYHVPLDLQCIYGRSDEGAENRDGEEGNNISGGEWRLPGLLCGELEEDLRAMLGCFAEVCRRCLKINAGKSKVMVLVGVEWLECEVCIDGIHLEQVYEFRYLECVLD